jgi:hypothetical protein
MINDHSPRWSVTFATDLPALARFDDGRIEFTLRLAEVKHGDRHFNHAISIDACYRPHSTPAGLALLREGHVVVRPDERAPSDESMQIKTLLTEKFDAIVPPELHFYGMSPPAGGALCKLNLLDLTEFKSTRGWLTLAYQLKGSSPRLNLAAQ